MTPRLLPPHAATFATEALLVDRFVGVLQSGKSRWGSVQVTTEWDHRSGMVDVLARSREPALIAFEAKLSDWRRAFQQAYRNTAYANRVFVLMPSQTAHRALAHRAEFELRGIGLCGFDGKAVTVLINASEQDELLTWLRRRAHEHFNEVFGEAAPRAARSRGRAVHAAQA